MATTIGQTKCLVCNEGIPVKRTDGGALSVNCPWCDFSGYAKKDTQAARVIAARIAKPADQAQDAKPAPVADDPPAAPAAAPKAKAKADGLPWMR